MMGMSLVFTLLFVNIVFNTIVPAWLEHVQNGESTFLSQHGFDSADQCIGNCSSRMNDFNLVSDSRDRPVRQVTEAMSNGIFGFIYSSMSSLLDSIYRVFVQPWIAMLGYGRSAPTDSNFYTVEDRSTVDPPLAAAPSVNWHDLGTTVFQVLSSLLGKNKVRPLKMPATFPSTDASADFAGPISAINPL